MLGRRRKDRQQRELAELDAFRHVRRAADEDLTRFGEELTDLHFDTLGSDLDETMRSDYQRALDCYEQAKAALARAATAADVTGVTEVLSDGRFSHACVLAAQSGQDRPQRRSPCFFDPAHGPASRDVEWAPVGGVPRSVPVCFRDAERLTRGEQPDVRLVRLGDRRVAWFASGPLYAAWAGGWYAELVREGRIEAERLTMAYAGVLPGQGGVQLPLAATWVDPGAWSDGGMIGGHDYSGWGGGDGGFGDGGGGGGDGGGGVGTAADPSRGRSLVQDSDHVRGRRRRREEELAALDRWRTARKMMDEDVTVLGEQVADLHLDTLADDLDVDAHDHYRRALENYDQAKQLLAASTSVEDVIAVEQVVADARYHCAAVLAVIAGDPLPERREPCFFNPQHGPSMRDVAWSPPGGTPRSIGVCAADARQLAAGDEPLVRMVRIGDRWVPWHQAGSITGAIDAGAQLARSSSHGVHGQQNLAQAYLNQTTSGMDGFGRP